MGLKLRFKFINRQAVAVWLRKVLTITEFAFGQQGEFFPKIRWV